MKQLATNIFIGSHLLSDPTIFAINDSAVLIVSQEIIYAHYTQYLNLLRETFSADLYFLPQNETNKTLAEWKKLLDFMVEKAFDRNLVVIAVGGGFVGDIAGFAASCFMRGVTLLQMPTTLLAQVDSAIGGKNGVNHSHGKNLIGTFYQPRGIYLDSVFLKTLSDRDYRAGLAEVIKYGVIQDAPFFNWLETNMPGLLARDDVLVRYAIEQSVQNKLRLVALDEKDLGDRNLLNFGHTFGHALEKLFSYEKLLHGEAVNIGMQMAAKLSLQFGLSESSYQRITKLLLMIAPDMRETISSPQLIDLMKRDKKSTHKKIKLILVKEIGQAFISTAVGEALIRQVIDGY